jgi:succinate dehydrogenase/fumarate reductase-like Fe-S protein
MIIRRSEIEHEEKRLAPYACRSAQTLGRENPIAPDPLRTDFQRDRDRVIHCSHFRKLEFKTQVFMTTASDYHRTRLTHTMEVAQIARTLSRALALNVDLTEAIALGHRYNLDTRDEGQSERNAVFREDGGVFACSYANECSVVCPKHVDPSGAIQQAKLNNVIDWVSGLVLRRGGAQ